MNSMEDQIGEPTVRGEAPWGTAAETFGQWYDSEYVKAQCELPTTRRITVRDVLELVSIIAASAALAMVF